MTNRSGAEDIAVSFLELIIEGKIEEAYESYVNPAGTHHNVYTPTGFAALKKGMQGAEVQFPHKLFSIKQTVSNGSMVVTYSHLVMEANTAGMAVMHMFRIEDGKIIEMWDCGQVLPADSPNEQGAF